MASTGSISVSGLLGGTAGSIDVPSLVSSLMQAESVPKNLLTDQLTTVKSKLTAYQAINTKLTAVQTAASGLLTTGTAWQATSATSSNAAVVATSSSAAKPGSTTFDVVRLAAAQVTTVAVATDGSVVADPSAGLTLTAADGTARTISLTSGKAADVAAAINNADAGVRASVIKTDQGTQLQLSSSKTGVSNGFSVAGFDATPKTLVAAVDAQLAVGGTDGYTVSSATNTFTGVIPGVSFSVSAPATGVTVSVASDSSTIAKAVQALVTAANSARSELAADGARGAVLQGALDVRSLANALVGGISKGTATGGSLKTYGIDVDQYGTISFDAAAFATAYAADPAKTQAAVGSLAADLNTTASGATDKATGNVTASIKGLTTSGTRLSAEIDDWTTRLADIQTTMQAKYAAMQSALARLQTQSTYMTSVLNSITNSKESSS